MKRPYSVEQGYVQEDLDSYMFVPDRNKLFVVIGDQGDEVYLSIEDEHGIFQDVVISHHSAAQIRDYLNRILK